MVGSPSILQLRAEIAFLREGIARIEQTPLGGYHVQTTPISWIPIPSTDVNK